MGKIDLGTTKYVVHLTVDISGIVEKPDVVGAIFGQTEGLLGNDLDLRELQKTGRIGRIEVNIESKGGRRQVIERAKDLLGTMIEDITPDTLEITEEVKKSIRLQQIREYGKDNLPAGPNIDDSDAIIIVEGRADVLHLLKHGIKNAICVEGTSIPQTVIVLSKQKTVTVFTDGDRGGELILRELLQVAEVDFVSRAPDGREVEELTKKELFKALRNKTPVEQVRGTMAIKKKPEEEKKKPEKIVQPPVQTTPKPAAAVKAPQKAVQTQAPPVKAPQKENGKVKKFKKLFDDLSGTLKAYLLDKDVNVIKEVAVRDLAVSLKNSKEEISTVIFDGVITQRLVEIANEKKVEHLVGAKVGNITKKPAELRLFTASDMG
jgi:DNA primase